MDKKEKKKNLNENCGSVARNFVNLELLVLEVLVAWF